MAPTTRLEGPIVHIPLSPPSFYEWFDLSSRPLLAMALENSRPAYSYYVGWLVDRLQSGVLKQREWHNYTQILRAPFSPRWLPEKGRKQTWAEAAQEAGNKILDDAELTLWYGKPRYDLRNSHPIGFCGGVLHYLKRRLYENDTVALRELQPLMLRDYRNLDDLPEGEWLMEFSLQVNPGHYQRGMKPLLIPPTPEALTNAWAQGASLTDAPQSARS